MCPRLVLSFVTSANCSGEASLGVMETWVEPEVLAARGINLTRPSIIEEMGFTPYDAEALGLSVSVEEESAHHLKPATNIELATSADTFVGSTAAWVLGVRCMAHGVASDWQVMRAVLGA